MIPLPIDNHLPDIVARVRKSRSLVLVALRAREKPRASADHLTRRAFVERSSEPGHASTPACRRPRQRRTNRR